MERKIMCIAVAKSCVLLLDTRTLDICGTVAGVAIPHSCLRVLILDPLF